MLKVIKDVVEELNLDGKGPRRKTLIDKEEE